MKNSENLMEAPAVYISWALSVLKEFYVVIDVDSAVDKESQAERYKNYIQGI